MEIALAAAIGAILGYVVLQTIGRRWLDGVYDREFRRQILKAKEDRPELAPWIDAETVRMGRGVIK